MDEVATKVLVNNDTLPRVDLTVRPGRITSTTVLQIHTVAAQKLVTGRGQQDGVAFVGLLLFAKVVGKIVATARAGDLYARWYLVQIEQRMREGQETIHSLEEGVKKKLNSGTGITINVGDSEQPLPIELNFASPYGYRGADLIAVFDEVVKMIVVGRRIGRIQNREGRQWMEEGRKAVRRVFALATQWKGLGQAVRLEDVQQHNELAQQAEASMGTLPEEVASGELMPDLVEMD